jgi:endonuclease/exonuclease/phosphatase (EEP) superfamily protein YafD
MKSSFILRLDFDSLLRLATAAIAAAIALAALGRYDWRFDLFSHWRVHYMLAGGILLPFLLFRRHYGYALLAIVIVFLNATGLRSAATAMAATGSDAPVVRAHHLRLAHFNVLFSNTSYGPTLEWLRQAKPDVVVLVEFTDEWGAAMEPLKAELPYRIEIPDGEGNGAALFSRYPLRDSARYRIGNLPKAAIRTVIAMGADEVTVIVAHPWPPTTPAQARDRDRYLAFILSLIRNGNGPLILSGDLNTTPWSYVFRDFVQSSGLAGRQALPTWPAELGLLGIPIDHVLGRAVNIESLSTGPRLGSDHRPLLADISF